MEELEEVKRKIEELEKEIKYEYRKLDACAYGETDLIYISGIENKLKDLEKLRDKIYDDEL